MSLTVAEAILGYGIDLIRQDDGAYEASANWEYGTVTVHGPDRQVALKRLVDEIFRERCNWVRKESKNRCSNCGAFGPGDVHHKVFRSHGRNDAIDNLTYLCHDCHHVVHSRSKPMVGRRSWKIAPVYRRDPT